jgi:hypothetical protein
MASLAWVYVEGFEASMSLLFVACEMTIDHGWLLPPSVSCAHSVHLSLFSPSMS